MSAQLAELPDDPVPKPPRRWMMARRESMLTALNVLQAVDGVAWRDRPEAAETDLLFCSDVCLIRFWIEQTSLHGQYRAAYAVEPIPEVE